MKMKELPYKKFSETAVGETLKRPALVTSIKEARDKNGNAFVKVSLQDGVSEIIPNMFGTSRDDLQRLGVAEGCIADVSLSVGEYAGSKNFTISKIAPTAANDVTIDDFIRTPPLKADDMLDEIIELLNSSANDYDGQCDPLSDLAVNMIESVKERFKTSSAAISMHHNMKSGLIYHTYRMVKAADAICTVYTDLDRELLLCATALHDIGKVWEYNTNLYGDAEFTTAGILFGHLYLGASLVKKFSKDGSYNTEKVQLLTHMILSHHGTMEFGAVKPPAFAEAFALHYIDNLDAKIGTCENYYSTLKPGEVTDKKPFGLDNRIYRPKL